MVRVLWATRIGEPDWMEQLITETSDTAHLAKAKQWAISNGFNRLREITVSDIPEAPDFTKVLNV